MIPIAEPYFDEKEVEYVMNAVKSGWVCLGEYIERFEKMFAELCKTKYAVSTSSGTTALHLALETLDIGRGDEVIVPTFTFVASVNAISYTNARPIFVDSDPVTWNIDVNKIEEAITNKTRAIMPVHLYGRPCEMHKIMEIVDKYNLFVIEDAAHAECVDYKGKMIGSIGDIGCFSFYGNKILVTGEGGMIVTDREDYAERAKMLRNHGMDKHVRYYHPIRGFNYRMTNIQAALGCAQLEKIDKIINEKRRIASKYDELLRNVDGLMIPKRDWNKDVCWLYTILIEPEFGLSRDGMRTYLHERGIETRPVFYPIHTMPMYSMYGINKNFSVAESLSKRGISLPTGANLTDKSVEWIVERLIGARDHIRKATKEIEFGFLKYGDEGRLWDAFFRCDHYTKSMYYPHPYIYDEAVRQIKVNTGEAYSGYRNRFIAGKCEDIVVAFGFLSFRKQEEGEMGFALAVVGEYQNKGIGTKMMDWIINYAQSNGFKKIYAAGGTARDGHLTPILKKKKFEVTREYIERDRVMFDMELKL